jgi:hypothetical protein
VLLALLVTNRKLDLKFRSTVIVGDKFNGAIFPPEALIRPPIIIALEEISWPKAYEPADRYQ